MFLPVGVGEIPTAAESQIKLNDHHTAIELGLGQGTLLWVQLQLSVEHFEVAGAPCRITLQGNCDSFLVGLHGASLFGADGFEFLAINEGVRNICEGIKSGLFVLQLGLLPGSDRLALLRLKRATRIDGAGEIARDAPDIGTAGSNSRERAACLPEKSSKANLRKEISDRYADLCVGGTNLLFAARTSGRRSSRAEGKPTGISGGTISSSNFAV